MINQPVMMINPTTGMPYGYKPPMHMHMPNTKSLYRREGEIGAATQIYAADVADKRELKDIHKAQVVEYKRVRKFDTDEKVKVSWDGHMIERIEEADPSAEKT